MDLLLLQVECLVNANRTGYGTRRVLCVQSPRFAAGLSSVGGLEEEAQAHGRSVISFYPKFHFELNFIERFWCAVRFYERENCGYSFDKLREIIPAALGFSFVYIYQLVLSSLYVDYICIS